MPTKRRHTFLLLKVMEHSRENVGTAANFVDSKPRNAENAKGNCMVVMLMAIVRAIQAQERRATSVA